MNSLMKLSILSFLMSNWKDKKSESNTNFITKIIKEREEVWR